MIILLNPTVSEAEIERVCEMGKERGYKMQLVQRRGLNTIFVNGDLRLEDFASIEMLPGVSKVIPTEQNYKYVNKKNVAEETVIELGDIKIGGGDVIIIAGPCAVESKEQLFETAYAVKEAGASILRGGAFKPRTSPYSFQGLGEEGLKILAQAREKTGLLILTEAIDTKSVGLVAEYADILQIGSRNMQNFSLLKQIGKCRKPALLKRGMSATVDEFLMAAEYILSEGNRDVILCERGIRTFNNRLRFTLDVSSIPLIKMISHLPIIADPSHGTGLWSMVAPMARAAVASGADGLLIEVHPEPEKALSDGIQSLNFNSFKVLMTELKQLANALGRKIFS